MLIYYKPNFFSNYAINSCKRAFALLSISCLVRFVSRLFNGSDKSCTKIALLIIGLCVTQYAAAQQADSNVVLMHNNGKPSEKGKYINAKKHGIWIYYYETGMMSQKEKWKHGTLLWQVYYTEKGKVSKTVNKKGKVTVRPACGC